MKQYGSTKPTLKDLLPSDRKDRIKLISAVVIFLICLIWLIYFVGSNINWSGPAKPLTTPAWITANELNAKLVERAEFHDVGFSVETERPLRYKVSGMVRTPKDLDKLKAFLVEIRPENDYDLDVVMPTQ